MKAIKITYWITTGLIVLGMLANAYNYFFNPTLKVAFDHLGFPDWFRVELGIAKLLGAFAIAIPAVPVRVKEWAYFGFSLSFSSAIIAHYNAGDSVFNIVAPLIMLLILVVSYFSYHKVVRQKIA
ncbi:DoxX family protein [Mucilaginibacter sp. UR6-11]|uniref:DoxX family protein n=1 Tax=Mucilaginibacter sp. UR6-11 TaxID=1435644 RepID=UPI001E2D7880|nr:DoxX family protein [Mucilaginibacter sp. UR6-11]MCC8423545.1 DoxX family protein [Mucilaginibacter sp. UR6-11]